MYENLAELIERISKLVDELAATDRSTWNDDEHKLFNIVQTTLARLNKLFKEAPDKDVPPDEMRYWLFGLRSSGTTIEGCSKWLVENYGEHFTDTQKQGLQDLFAVSQQFMEMMFQMALKLNEAIWKTSNNQ